MPTMTNPETGETKEISMEEFMKMVSQGGGSVGIQQVVTDKDGNKHVTDIYGNMSGMNDGLDRSVNIFCDKKAFNAFIYAAIMDIKKANEEDYAETADEGYDPNDKNYVMTVDFTDSAMTCVLTCTDEKVELCFYTRDERKSNSRVDQKSEWGVDAEGHVNITGEDLQNDPTSLYFLSFRQMRRFLRKTGKLAKLKELGNKGTGVIIYGQDKGEGLDAKIVRGRNRPDLPCNVFLLGEQMMRPYPDELMTNMMMSNMSLEDKITAAEGGDPDCMESLAQAYLNGDDVAQDFEKSAYWWEKLAETENAIGQFNIGLHYAKGCGVKRNFEKAAEWMQKAADNGDEDAPNVAKMYKEMSDNLQKAQAGDVKAQAVLAKAYMQIGGSLEQFGPGNDYEESFRWSKKAADREDLDAMYCLALCYEHGRGTTINPTKAAMTYQKAAELGHAPSQWNLAVCYLNGQGYERNEAKGLSWAYESAAQGYDLAIQGLERQGKTIPQIIERFSDDETGVSLEGTQYEGRADRCERIRAGMELTYKIVKDKNGDDVLECFYNGGSVGLLSKWVVSDVIALLNLNRISLTIKVKSCIPKSQRGTRTRNADVHLHLTIKEKKPETPEERAARLEKERLAAEKAKREAEEAKRKAEEQKARQEAEKKQYELNLASWKERCSDIKSQRDKKVEEQIQIEKSKLEAAAKTRHDAAVALNQGVIDEQTKRKSDAEQLLATLGFFKFSEKKSQKAIIEDSEKKAADARAAILVAEDEYKASSASSLANAKKKEHSIRSGIEKELPLPAEPEMPAFMQAAKPVMTATQTANQGYKRAILNFLANGGAYTLTELMENVPEISDLSNQRVAAIVRQMFESGDLKREEIKRKAFFSLA